jgi:hypothetical protein
MCNWEKLRVFNTYFILLELDLNFRKNIDIFINFKYFI